MDNHCEEVCESDGGDCCAPGLEEMKCRSGYHPQFNYKGCFLDSRATYTCCSGPGSGESANAIFLILGFILGFSYCFGCCLCCRFHHAPADTKKKVHLSLGLSWLIITLVFWLGIVPASSPERTDVKKRREVLLAGGLGDLFGLIFGVIILHCLLKDKDLSKPWELFRHKQPAPVNSTSVASVADPSEDNVSPPTVVGQIANAQQDGPSNAIISNNNIVLAPSLVVTGTPVAQQSNSKTQPEASMRPTLAVMVAEFKRELDVGGSSMVETVDAACLQLGISTSTQNSDSVLERAEACWLALHGAQAVTGATV